MYRYEVLNKTELAEKSIKKGHKKESTEKRSQERKKNEQGYLEKDRLQPGWEKIADQERSFLTHLAFHIHQVSPSSKKKVLKPV